VTGCSQRAKGRLRGKGGPLELSFPGGNEVQTSPSRPQKQAQNRGGRAPRAKGNRLERAIVRLLQDAGLGAERVPLSGSAGGAYSGDLMIPILNRDLVVEAKARANGFSRLYSWLERRDLLIIKADRRDALVILPLRLAVEIATAAESRKSPSEFPVPESTAKTAALAQTQGSRSPGHSAKLNLELKD
jgi:Holliday junction resolvase